MATKYLSLALAALIACAGCQRAGPSADASQKITPFKGEHPIKVACTVGMAADLVRHIGGRHVAVEQMMGEGVDPHLYKASPGDVRKLRSADLLVYVGLHLEGKMADVLENLGKEKPALAVGESLPREKLIDVGDGHYDPHVWFDVALWAEAARSVRDLLVAFDPAHASEYQANAAALDKQLTELHEYCKTQLAQIPRERRVLVTAHDAFHYFGRAYDIEVRAIQGISTESEAGVKEINELVDFIASRKIKAVFVESSVSERNVQALVEGCKNAHGHTVVIGGELFSDAMGKEGTAEGTYIGMVRHNVDTIVRALR